MLSDGFYGKFSKNMNYHIEKTHKNIIKFQLHKM